MTPDTRDSVTRRPDDIPTSRSENPAPANRRWWILLLLQPLLLVAAGLLVIAAIGVAQRAGWIVATDIVEPRTADAGTESNYICPMMCTPPQSDPGRCPVCGMELVSARSAGMGGQNSIQI